VLLKNVNTLPLSKSLKTVAVIGPNADDIDVLLGNYNGIPTAPITPLEGIRRQTRCEHARDLRPRQRPRAKRPNFEAIPSTRPLHFERREPQERTHGRIL